MEKTTATHVNSHSTTIGCSHIIEHCANLKAQEKVLIISDTTCKDVGNLFAATARKIAPDAKHISIEPLTRHGEEPPGGVGEEMLVSDVVFCVTKMSLAHTMARWRASQKGMRFLSLPDYSLSLLSRPSIKVDFRNLKQKADSLAEVLTNAKNIHVMSDKGTDISLSIDNRMSNSCSGWCSDPGCLASPPDAEVNIAPVEELSNGIIVVDGSVPCPEIGLLKKDITLHIKQGPITEVEGTEAEKIVQVLDRYHDPSARILAEIGIGLNPKARLCGIMLEDEGCLGTVHFGFGSNATIGGGDKSTQHIDFIVKHVSLTADETLLIKDGKLQI
ncbi:aminopeptidase [Fibrobacterota bacterium]